MSQPGVFDPNQPAAVPERTSGWATASLIFGIGGFCLWLFAGIPAIICGIVGMNKASQPGVGGKGLAIAGIITGAVSTFMPIVPAILVALLLPALNTVRESARRSLSSANMKQQALAAIMYEESNGHYPAAADESQGPPVSWRTALAPYIEAGYVHDAYNFQEPWDSANNRPLADQLPQVFENPSLTVDRVTNYLALVGDETAFPRSTGARDIAASSQTILFVEADEDRSVPWTKPQDIDYDPADPLAGLGTMRRGGFLVTFADTSTQMISNDVDPEVFRALVTRSDEDNDSIGSFFLE